MKGIVKKKKKTYLMEIMVVGLYVKYKELSWNQQIEQL